MTVAPDIENFYTTIQRRRQDVQRILSNSNISADNDFFDTLKAWSQACFDVTVPVDISGQWSAAYRQVSRKDWRDNPDGPSARHMPTPQDVIELNQTGSLITGIQDNATHHQRLDGCYIGTGSDGADLFYYRLDRLNVKTQEASNLHGVIAAKDGAIESAVIGTSGNDNIPGSFRELIGRVRVAALPPAP